MKKTRKVRPRNPLVVPALFRKAGRHKTTYKAQRSAEIARLRKLAAAEGNDFETSYGMTLLCARGVMPWLVAGVRKQVMVR